MYGRVGLWCNDRDWICGSSKSALNTSGHDKYAENGGAIDDAARLIASKIIKREYFESQNETELPVVKSGITFLSSLDRPRYGQDLMVVLDRNDENDLKFSLRMQAVLRLADTYWDNGGRFGIATLCHTSSFNGSGDTHYNVSGLLERGRNETHQNRTGAEILGDFRSSNHYCGSGYAHGNQYGTATTVALDAPQWRSEVEKAILLSSNHHPNDITNPELKNYIKKRAIEIDPVNIYTVSPSGSNSESFKEISDATGGRSLFYDEMQMTADQAIKQVSDTITDRPIVRPSVNLFSATLGEPIVLSVWSSLDEVDDHISYRWDYNADGVWDATTAQPFGVTTFSSLGEKIVHVEVTGSDGSRASTVVYVAVSQPEPQPQSTTEMAPPTDIRYIILATKDNKSTIRLEWKPQSTVYRYMLSIDGIHEGWLDNTRTSIDLLDIDRTREVTIALQAYDQNLTFGDRAGIVVPPLPVEQAPQLRVSSAQTPEQQAQEQSRSVQSSLVLGSQATDPESTPFMLAQSRDKAGQPTSSSSDTIGWIVGAGTLLLALLSLIYFYRRRATILHK